MAAGLFLWGLPIWLSLPALSLLSDTHAHDNVIEFPNPVFPRLGGPILSSAQLLECGEIQIEGQMGT